VRYCRTRSGPRLHSDGSYFLTAWVGLLALRLRMASALVGSNRGVGAFG
jgi:hypothetical protein